MTICFQVEDLNLKLWILPIRYLLIMQTALKWILKEALINLLQFFENDENIEFSHTWIKTELTKVKL